MNVLVYNSSGLVLSFITFTMVATEPHHYRFVHSSVEFEDLKLERLITPLSTQLNYDVFRYVDYWSCVRMLSVFLILKLTYLILA